MTESKMALKRFHSLTLSLLMILSLAAPIADLAIFPTTTSLGDEGGEIDLRMSAVGFGSGAGSQYLLGTQNINGITWDVNPQTALERHAWVQLHGSSADDLADKEELSMGIDAFGQIHACWRQHDNASSTNYSLWSATYDDEGVVEKTRVSDSRNPGISCDFAIDLRGDQRMAWINGDDNSISIGRQVSPSYINSERTFHNRTVMDNQDADSLQIVIDADAKEYILWRNSTTNKLWMTNYTSSYWTTWKVLDRPIGKQFNVGIDESGLISVVYLDLLTEEIRLVEFTSSEDISLRVLEGGELSGSTIAVAQEPNGNEQVLYTLKNDSGTVRLLRNLAGKDTGRIDTTPRWTTPTIAQGDMAMRVISDADINGDGYSDLIWAEPMADIGGNETGLVSIHLGAENGLSDIADIVLNGTFDGEHFGHGLAVCDVDGDGKDDLAIGRPGAGTSNTGAVVLYSGTTAGLAANPSWNYFGRGHDNQTGWALECAGNTNADGYEDLLVSSRGANTSSSGSGGVGTELFGIVDLFFGSSSGLASSPDWSRNGTTLDSHFGTTMAGQADFNGDGYDDFAISATGTMDDYFGYSEVLLWAGAEYGPTAEPERRISSTAQGKLFGFSLAWSDVNGDGNDDLAIGEPYNSSTGYLSGKVWLFHGVSDSNVTTSPAWSLSPTQNSALTGVALSAAGDVNEDGYEDLIITMGGIGSKGGNVELWLGSASGLEDSGQLIASGGLGERNGWSLATGGDLNGDGMSEIVFSHRQVENASSWNASLSLVSEQDWESIDIQVGGTIQDADLGVGPDGESFILITNQSNGLNSVILMRQDSDGSAIPRWVQTEIISISGSVEAELVVDGGGRAWAMMVSDLPHGGVALEMFQPVMSWVSMSNRLAETGDIGNFPALAVDESDMIHVAFFDNSTNRLWYSKESQTGWVTETVRSQISISSDILIGLDSSSTELIYRDEGDETLYLATKSSGSWSEDTIGETTISSHVQVELANGTHHLSSWNISGNSTFGFMPRDGNTDNFSAVPLLIQSDSTYRAASLPNGSILLAWSNTSGEGGIITNLGEEDGNWTLLDTWGEKNSTAAGVTISQRDNVTYVALYNDNSRGDFHAYEYYNSTLLHVVNQSGVIGVSSADPVAEFIPDGIQAITHRNGGANANISAMEAHSQSGAFLMRTPDEGISLVNHGSFATMPASLATGPTSGPIAFAQTSDGGLRIALFDTVLRDMVIYRLEADSDGDNIPDIDDDLPSVSGQWLDQDGDGWGDNPDGPATDACKITSGTSDRIEFGCADIDGDGWPNHIETSGCTIDAGDSFLDRIGCDDLDQDGWSDNGVGWLNGDAYMSNWKQTKDTDGDTRGDNHGPDCCTTFHPSTGFEDNSTDPDPFPHNYHQWVDTDGDGYGDNYSHESGDQCTLVYGLSHNDRPGCPDSDGDGYSDASGSWDEAAGADKWSDDSTQWWDSDGDGHGDNSSDDATNPDKFPAIPVAAIDNDNDGYPDAWTSLFTNSSNTSGLNLDDCPGVDGFGESFRDRFGCPDSDGDGTSDLGDPFPLEASQWQDTDGDGFGDNPSGILGDMCPTVVGFYNGTLGPGCPIVNTDDDDLDGVGNDEDQCEETPDGETVNFSGCSESQLDDDLDGIANSLDSCPGTVTGESVDEIGCSQSQSETDSDGDGVLDPSDNCPETATDAEVDSDGCSADQRDSDEDGVSDLADLCPGTPTGAAVDGDGCIVAGVDSDADGIDDVDDPFPGDSTQWSDQDGDGYGDNSTGLNSDRCPTVNGSSSEDRQGCPDSDGDGWSDPDAVGTWGVSSGADAFIDEPSQWRDADLDGFGDNLSGVNADYCQDTGFGWLDKVDENGCAANQIDTDGDGIADISDTCPNLLGPFSNGGCPLDDSGGEGDGNDEGLLGMSTNTLLISGGIAGGVIFLFIIVLVILRNDDYDDDDDDDWDEDDYYEDEEDGELLSSFGAAPKRKSNPNAMKSPPPSQSGGFSGGPSGGPPSGPSGGPPSDRGGPSGGPPSGTAPTRGRAPSHGGVKVKASRKKVTGADVIEESEGNGNKVRRARAVKAEETTDYRPPWMEEDEQLFTDSDEDNKASSIGWAWDEMQASTSERNILMQLQETGWSVEQSRAIIDEANKY